MLHRIDLSRTDLNLLVLLEVLLEERHVGRAAERLNLSPSAVSHGLGRLRRLLNDPLFIRHPKGLNPTERAVALTGPVGEILSQTRALVAAAGPFDPASSHRRFVIGAVEAIGAVVVPDLVVAIERVAPNVTLAVRSIFPDEVTARLDGGEIDLALTPLLAPPARFQTHVLYAEEFVIAARVGHPLLQQPTLEAFCAASHLLVAQGTDRGFVDDVLESRGLARSVSLSVPSFMWALAVLAETDLVAALPRGLVARHGRRAGVASAEPPIPFSSDRIGIVAPRAAESDPGLTWLSGLIIETARG
jgi:DNA-binding transcriptional LysR family regulator